MLMKKFLSFVQNAFTPSNTFIGVSWWVVVPIPTVPKPLVINGEQQYNKQGYPIILDRKHPTITGLALALGFSGRSDLLYYQKHKKDSDKFYDTITRAKSRVEEQMEESLFHKDSSNGAQFALRNNFKDWDADKKQEENKTEGITIVNNIPRE